MSDTHSLYKTPSLHLAAYLMTCGIELQGIEPMKNEPDRFVFVFSNTEACPDLTAQFLVGQGGEVNVHHFLGSLQRLKNLVHERPVW